MADRVYEVMMGEDPRADEIGILHQMAHARKEWIKNGIPQCWIDRIFINFYHCKLQISGCANWYYNSGTKRYEPKAFIVPNTVEKAMTLLSRTVFSLKNSIKFYI